MEKNIIQFDQNLWKNVKGKNRIGIIEKFLIDDIPLEKYLFLETINYVKINFISSGQKEPDLK